MSICRTVVIRFIFLAILTVSLSGCAFNVPVSTELKIDNPSAKKLPKKVLVVMSKDEVDSAYSHKENAFADKLVFAAGKSIQSNLLRAMGSMFSQADFANAIPATKGGYDYYLLADFKDAKLQTGTTIFGESKFNIFTDFDLLDAQGARLKKIETNGEVQKGFSSSTKWTVLASSVASGLSKQRDLGRLWDDAMANSLTQLMQEMEVVLNQK